MQTIAPFHVDMGLERRIERVVDLIDESLAEPLTLEQLSQHAALSPFHFHRVFSRLTGETAGAFLRRRRIEAAAGRLHHSPDEKLTDVALEAGFGSTQAFTRAFSLHLGVPPRSWCPSPACSTLADAERSANDSGSRVEVRRRLPSTICYLRQRGPYSETTAQLWDRALWSFERLGLTDQPLLSMGLDDPRIAAPSACRLDACIELPDALAYACSDLLMHRTLHGGLHAVMGYVGQSRDLHSGWAHLLYDWLPRSAFALRSGPFFAVHRRDLSFPGGQSLNCELHMPIRRRRDR